MRDSEGEGNLIKGFKENDNYLLTDDEREEKKDNSKRNKFILIFIIILVILVGIIVILIIFLSNDDSDSESKDEEKIDPANEIDTIPNEEMNKARNAFKHLTYNETTNGNYSLDYNLFIPKNYTKEKKYPLIMFIEDGSLVGPGKSKSPLDETVGGPIWATDREQEKHECFVLVPHYNEALIDDNRGNYYISEYINVTVRLINNLIEEYSINPDRIYSTGQSMGAMTTLYLLANYPNLLAAGLIVDGQWYLQDLVGLVNATFTYFAAGGDEKAFNGQTEVKKYFDSLNLSYGELTEVDAQEKVENLNKMANSMYNLSYPYNFITYKKGSVFPPNTKKIMEHMASFKYGYRIDIVRDWIFQQNRIKCEEGSYYSEDGKCADINFCKVSKKDSSCKECIYGYYLTSDRSACTRDENCETGNKENGECFTCKIDYYMDLQEKNCKDSTIDERYRFCIIVDNGVCNECQSAYFLSDDHKCTITPNCSISNNSLCIECQEGFYLGYDQRCCSTEKCIYSYMGDCNECSDGYYLEVESETCIESTDNFINCKKNNYFYPERCDLCKNDFYISLKDYLCYDNTQPGPFYKCQITNYLGEKCQNCIDGYYIGRIDSNCSRIPGCLHSLDENTCLECDEFYCIDNKGDCIDNYYVIDPDEKYYFRCKNLTADGTKCDTCERDFNVTEEGICFDDGHCAVFEDGKCKKCQEDNPWGYLTYCLNEVFGCVDSFLNHCIRCDDIMDLNFCTECEEGYEIDEYGDCVEIEYNSE